MYRVALAYRTRLIRRGSPLPPLRSALQPLRPAVTHRRRTDDHHRLGRGNRAFFDTWGQQIRIRSRDPRTAGPAFEQFYAEAFLPHVPADLVLTRMSRTVDRFHLVDETTVSFTHDRELPWLLPGVTPTRRRAEVLAVAIVGFERGRIRSQRILWDHATLTAQLGMPAPARLRPGPPGRPPR